jgi:hypothetical protein
MTDIKRLNYFTSQFLGEKDFNEEQDYHVDMRRRHNRLLHSWGIADGLAVTRGGNKTVTVGAGTAIDKNGNEIVLRDPATKDLSVFGADKWIWLTLKYHEELTDRTQGGDTRWVERPTIEADTTLPAQDGSVIVVGKIWTDPGGDIKGIYPDLRKTAGPRGDAVVKILTVEGAATLKNSLTVEGAATLKNSLTVEGAATLKNSLTVEGAATLKNSLTVEGAATLKNSLTVEGAATLKNSLTVEDIATLQKSLTMTSGQAAQTTAGKNTLDIQTESRSGTHKEGLALYVTATSGEDSRGVEFRHSNGSMGIGFGYHTIYATGPSDQPLRLKAKGAGRVEIIHDGQTPFPVAGGVEALRIIRGIVNGNGAPLAGTVFSGFSVAKVRDTNLYDIIFNPTFPTMPAASTTQVWPNNPVGDPGEGSGSSGDSANIVQLRPDGMRVATFAGSGRSAGDRAFSFIVIGPQRA